MAAFIGVSRARMGGRQIQSCEDELIEMIEVIAFLGVGVNSSRVWSGVFRRERTELQGDYSVDDA